MFKFLNRHSSLSWRVILLQVVFFVPLSAAHAEEPAVIVDAKTLHHKVMCGYQGWFRCPGDATKDGWRHWSRNSSRISPNTLTFEMWPEMSEYAADEQFAAPGFTFPNGKPATLFSSAHPKTVERHFEWMRQYGIDGAFVQRFLVEANNRSTNDVLQHARAAAKKSGRAYAVGYDLSGMPAERLLESITTDWKRLVDEQKLTSDAQYLHHAGKPVLFVWGFYSDRFSAKLANQLIDFFQHDERYAVTL
ncbi:MAG TPA: hypothetical protein VL096_11705, partial [Pirellulaceae bacterium]|nr:hypothetical protein [Pirellulaceae bacterium]